MDPPPSPLRVLISYRHESPAHSAAVLALADRLRKEGVDAWVDVYESWPARGWRSWMREQLAAADWVLCVASSGYRAAAEGRGIGDVARGAAFEGAIIDQELYDAHEQNLRFVPVLLGGHTERDLPDFLRRYRQFTLDADYDALYALLTAQAAGAPPLGERRVLPAPVRGVGARPSRDVPRALVNYLQWLARFLDVIPTFDDGTEAPLTDLYVGLSGGAVGSGERRLLDDLIHRDRRGRWTVQGDPGAGKSTLLRHLAVRIARESGAAAAEGRDPGPASIPILVNLAELGEGPLLGAVLDRALADHARTCADTADVRAALEGVLHEGGALLLLDGLDEVDPGRRGSVLAALRELARVRSDCGFVITSRRFGYQRPNHTFVEVEILPLTRDDQRGILGRMLGTNRAEGCLAEIDLHFSLQDLAANPFTLCLLGILARTGAPLPERRVQVYRHVLDWMIGRSLSSVPTIDALEGRRTLRALALDLIERGAGPWTAEELDARAPGRVLTLARASRILVEVPGGRWRFAHRTLMECLAAEAMVAAGVDEHAQRLAGGVWWKPWTLRNPGDVGKWAEVYALVAALDPDPEARLGRLASIHPELARRAAVGVDTLAVERLQALWGADRPVGLVREILQRVPDPDQAARALLGLGLRARDADTAAYVAAGLLLRGRLDELATLRTRRRENTGVPAFPWVEVPPGSFLMGSPPGVGHDDEQPRHEVRFTRGFRVLATPVTQALYAVAAGSSPSHFQGDPRRPVESVTWFDAVRWCNALSAAEKRPLAYTIGGGDTPKVTVDLAIPGYRLPTEAEWEYLCRAGTETRWSFGDDEASLGEHAWFAGSAGDTTHPVGEKRPNPWGLYDVHGNVWEWCQDVWDGTAYPKERAGIVTADPLGAVGVRRVFRGGSCNVVPGGCRSACRNRWNPDDRSRSRGFRVVLPLPQSGLDP